MKIHVGWFALSVFAFGLQHLSATAPDAVERLYAIKERPKDKPFTVHIDRKDRVEEFVPFIPVVAYKMMVKFWPGPLTLIFNAKQGTVGIRMPDDEVAASIIDGERARGPVGAQRRGVGIDDPPSTGHLQPGGCR